MAKLNNSKNPPLEMTCWGSIYLIKEVKFVKLIKIRLYIKFYKNQKVYFYIH